VTLCELQHVSFEGGSRSHLQNSECTTVSAVKQVCVQLPTSAAEVTLLAFAAECCAAAPLAVNRYLLPASGTQIPLHILCSVKS